MVAEEVVGALEEEIVDYLVAVFAVVVVPCDVDTVPLAVLHLHVIPHMCGLFVWVIVAEYAHAGDALAVTYELERL